MKWFFVDLNNLNKTKKDYYCVDLKNAKKKGLKFEELIGRYRQLRL